MHWALPGPDGCHKPYQVRYYPGFSGGIKVFEALNQSDVTIWLNSLLWGFPSAEIFHIVMTGGFFGSVVLMDLRLLGFHRFLSANQLLRHAIPCLWWLFLGVLLSGILLFLYMPLEYSGNPAFLLKMVLIPIGGINSLLMHVVLMRNQHVWDSHGRPPFAVRFSAFISLLVWMGALACGRLIAYYYGF